MRGMSNRATLMIVWPAGRLLDARLEWAWGKVREWQGDGFTVEREDGMVMLRGDDGDAQQVEVRADCAAAVMTVLVMLELMER
jgi:hypothetical protein